MPAGYRSRKQPNGAWRAFWKCDNTCDSSERYGYCKEHSKTGFTTRRDADSYGKAQHTDAVTHGWDTVNTKAPYLKDAAAHWLRSRIGVRKSTRKQNRDYVNNYITPHLGQVRCDKLTVKRLKEWVAMLADEGSRDGEPLAASTVEKAHRNLFQILDNAVEDGLVRSDRLPKRLTSAQLPKKEKRKVNPMTRDQLMTLADVIDPRYRIIVLLGGLAGLRISEIAGLQPHHLVNRQDGPWLKVVHQLDRDSAQFIPCKTDSSERDIPIAQPLETELLKHMKLHPPSKALTIVSAPQGSALNYTNFRRRVWVPAMRTMAELIPGFEYRTIHDLRHTYASLLILGGTHSKIIQQHLGHSSTRVTDDIYGHLIEDASSQGRDTIEQLMADLNAQTLQLVSDQTLTPQTAA